MLLEKRNIRTQLYKGRLEDDVFLLVDTVLRVKLFLEINFEALQGLKYILNYS